MASLASQAEQVVFCSTDTLLCGRDLFPSKQPSHGIFDHHLQANPSTAHSKVSWVFLQTYLQPCRLQNRPLHWSFKPLIDQRQNWSRLARKRLGSNSLLCSCSSSLTGVQDVIIISRQLQLMRSLSSQLFYKFFVNTEHFNPSWDVSEFALSEVDAVYRGIPVLGSRVGRGCGCGCLG